MRDVGAEKDGVAGSEIVDLVGDEDAEGAGQHHERLAGAGAVRLASKHPAREKAKLVHLEPWRRSGGGEETALHPPVGAPERGGVARAEETRLANVLPAEEALERDLEADRDLPEHGEGRVRPRALDLRERGAADSARGGEPVEGEAAILSKPAEVLRDPPREVGGAHVVTR